MKRKTFVTAVATAIMLTMTVPSAMAETGNAPAPAAATVDFKAAADKYLAENAAQYELRSDLSDLQYATTITTDAATYVRYQQTVQGAPVFNSMVTVTLDNSGQAVTVVSDYTPVQGVEQLKGKLTDNAAEDKALTHLNAKGKALWEKTSRTFGFVIEDGVAVPAYKVVVHTSEPFGAWETMVHAGDGKLLKKRDLNVHATGTGNVFLPNPVESQGSITGLTDGNNANSTALTNQLKSVTLQGLNGTGYLKGSYVSISSKANTYSATNTFNFNRSQAGFEDVMAYYHIDTVQRYIQSLGFSNILNRAITVNLGKYTADNSYYSPSTKALTFGSGGVDDAEDAGVIIHEYGHAIQDNQVPGFGATLEGGAMGEAFGDYLGATYEDSLTPSSNYGNACVAEWDAVSYASGNPPCLRRLDENKVMPGDWYGEVHVDGEIWSQGEYEMAKAFGRDVATKIILQSHFSLTPSSGFNDGARAIKAADQLLYGGSHAAQIDAIWSARGISTN